MKKNDEPDIVAVLAQVIENPDDLLMMMEILQDSALISGMKTQMIAL